MRESGQKRSVSVELIWFLFKGKARRSSPQRGRVCQLEEEVEC